MSGKSPVTEAVGRPALPLNDRGVIFGRLAVCEKGSPEFRKVRRELASEYDRTESAIQKLFQRELADFLNRNGREPLTATRP